jgi:hypothetical protein
LVGKTNAGALSETVFFKGEVAMCYPIARALILGCFLLTGCATSGSKDLEGGIERGSVVVGFIQVEPTEPYVRLHQTEPLVRFFDVMNSRTGEWTRVPMTGKAERFVTRLSPGHYDLVRIQIGEGPFRSESQVNMSFDVLEDKTMYLGIWRLRVEAPKTERMLHWEVLAEAPDWDLVVALHPELGEKVLVVSPPTPTIHQMRLFAVAPSQPRAKYFYRR